MFFFTDLRDELARYLSQEEVARVTEAFLLAEQAHDGQVRRTGEPYISHPVAVARILADMRMDYESIIAAMLHDVLEDTLVTKKDLETHFGEPVAELVDGVSKLTQIKFENRAEQQAENFRKMLLAMSRDIRVIIVKLADRLHNMRTVNVLPTAKRRRIARETLDIYAPIANRLGMNTVRVEYEDLGFATLYPARSQVLKEAIRKARGNRKEIMQMIEARLQSGLKEAGLAPDVVHGREKHLYSIYKKMRDKQLSFSQIMDFYAFRIIVESEDHCYRALGIIHRLYKPVPGRFKDYIAIPKANGYQSLHTILFGPYGVPIEIQIRTEKMHQVAENGIAAHWLYKTPETSVTQAQATASGWLKNLLEMQKRTGNSLEFMQNVKIDLFPDEVYVFTPKGDIIELPFGATAVDFAYTVHTDIGNACIAARIDRHLAPLSSVLENGQTVEIITAPGARPNPAWLNFVQTGKARSNIRHFLKVQKQAEAVMLGRKLLETSLSAYKLTIDNLDETILEQYLFEISLKSMEELFADIGIGNRTGLLAAKRLADLQTEITGKNQPLLQPRECLSIKGTEGMVVNFAKCCWPIPGDPIVGYLGYGQGLTIHTETCRNVAGFRGKAEKIVPVCWEDEMEKEFQAELKLELVNERGILAVLTSAIASESANIDTIRSEDKDGRYAIISMILAVKNRQHLACVMRRLRNIKQIVKISRSR